MLKFLTSVFSPESLVPDNPDIGEIKGQAEAKGALLICAAGGHNLLMVGPPGEGKSVLAESMRSFLPPLTYDERKERNYHIGEQYLVGDKYLRPFASINPTTTIANLLGGGRSKPIPGILPKANRGVVFIDELPYLPTAILEALRQPLESGRVEITRSGTTRIYPCNIQIVAALNPCPCGYLGYASCSCSDSAIARYRAKLSGPMLDRIDCKVSLEGLDNDTRFNSESKIGQSVEYLKIVMRARARQRERYKHSSILNSMVGARYVFHHTSMLGFSSAGMKYFKAATDKPRYSTRSIVRIARVARTIADCYDCDSVNEWHIASAIDLAATPDNL